MTDRVVAESLAEGSPDLAQLPVDETAGVLFLIQELPGQEPLLLLTKRSAWVKQPGDLCCPGGRMHPILDGALSRILRAPGSPLVRSPGWRLAAGRSGVWSRRLSLFWACSLRESWEETGLRPWWGVQFLGILPVYRLAMFRRGILPLVGWLRGEKRFRLNWEVERLVPIPLPALLMPENYGAYLLEAEGAEPLRWGESPASFPCFIHRDQERTEILWGATYQIAMTFLARVFGFAPPPAASRPVVTGTLSSTYTTGEPRVR